MLHVAFFRNLNLGQGRAPRTGAALEEPFRAAGASSVRSFQTNGTVAFDAGNRDVAAVIAAVSRSLAATTGYADRCLVKPAWLVVGLIAELRDTVAPEHMVTFFDESDAHKVADIATLGRGPGWVVTRFDRTPHNPSREVLAAIGPRATTRTFGTITRLCRALKLTDSAPSATPSAVDLPQDLDTVLGQPSLLTSTR